MCKGCQWLGWPSVQDDGRQCVPLGSLTDGRRGNGGSLLLSLLSLDPHKSEGQT